MRINSKGIKAKLLINKAAVVVVLLLLLVPSAKPALAEPLRIGVTPTAHSALIYIADSQGFLKKQGVDLLIHDYQAGALAIHDLISDKIDVATTSEYVFVMQSFGHSDLRMPAAVCISSDNELIVRKDRNIAQPQDLKGRRVAVVRGSSAEFFLYNYLIFNRISADSVRVVYQTPSEMIKTMVEGTIDAALCWPPHTTEMAKQLGPAGSRWSAQSGQDYYFALSTKEGFLKKQPKTMERFLAGLLDAEAFIAKYSEQAQTILRQRLKADPEAFSATWSRSRFQLQLSQDMLVLMEREAKWAIRSKIVDSKEAPNFLDFFYFQALDKVKPEAVSIVH